MKIVLAKAPMRISLGGGGTDIPSYADQFGGMVISLAISRHVAVTVFPNTFDNSISHFGKESESVFQVDHLGSPFFRAALKRSGVTGNIQLSVLSDAPAGTGLGGSGAFTVALMAALKPDNALDPVELAEEASAIEIDDLERSVGKQDHYLAALGGVKALHIEENRRVRYTNITTNQALNDFVARRLMLFYTGVSRDAGLVLANQDNLTRSGNPQTLNSLHRIKKIGEQMYEAIVNESLNDIGPLLNEHWQNKVRLGAKVSNSAIDEIYAKCVSAGCDGGKLLGAGGGGFLLMCAPENKIDSVKRVASKFNLREMPFKLEQCGVAVSAL